MDRNVGSFTVLFQPPFWVGIAERWGAEGYSAARVVFGPEPTDAQLYQWLEREWHRLNFSPAAEGERPAAERKNPKRTQREAQAATRDRGVSTRAQEALSRQREPQRTGAAGEIPSAPTEKAREKAGPVKTAPLLRFKKSFENPEKTPCYFPENKLQ